MLDAPAYAYRISMLEALANEIYAEAVTVGAFENNALTKRLIDIYEQSYYRRTFDIQQYTGEYYDFSRLSSGRVKAAISEKWNGKNYSERVWDNTEKTAEALRSAVFQSLMTGQDYKTTEQMFLSVLGEDSDSGARFKASRLIRTEVNYISGKATTKAYEEAGIEEYTYLATLDKRTCHDCGDSNRKSCAELDGKHFKVSEAEVGVNKHPMHPFCRCSDCPYIPGRKTVRSARDENGKSIQVPGDMTYDEWWDRYVDNSGESGIIEPKEMYRKKNGTHRLIGANGQQIIDQPTYNKLTKQFIKQGGIIVRGERATKHLKNTHSHAAYLPSLNAAVISEEATISEVLEEMYHAKQDRCNMFGDVLTEEVLCRREIDAQHYLLSLTEKYKIPESEVELTKKNLEYYENRLKSLLGE